MFYGQGYKANIDERINFAQEEKAPKDVIFYLPGAGIRTSWVAPKSRRRWVRIADVTNNKAIDFFKKQGWL